MLVCNFRFNFKFDDFFFFCLLLKLKIKNGAELLVIIPALDMYWQLLQNVGLLRKQL